jgi:hypothetical protein
MAVEADRRSGHEDPQARGGGGDFGQPSGGPDPGLADGPAVRLGESARDGLARQMHQSVHAGQQVWGGIVWVPTSFALVGRCATDQTDHPVATGRQESRQRGADKSGRTGDGDDELSGSGSGGVAVGGKILGQLAMPIGEGRAQCRSGHSGVDLVEHAGFTRTVLAEAVGVSPPSDDPGRHGHQPVRGQHVDELVRRVIARRVVPGHPTQPAW